jgi:hypothetical protein
MIKLFSERLIIRDYVVEDLNNHHELLSDDTVMYYLQDIKQKILKTLKKT